MCKLRIFSDKSTIPDHIMLLKLKMITMITPLTTLQIIHNQIFIRTTATLTQKKKKKKNKLQTITAL